MYKDSQYYSKSKKKYAGRRAILQLCASKRKRLNIYLTSLKKISGGSQVLNVRQCERRRQKELHTNGRGGGAIFVSHSLCGLL